MTNDRGGRGECRRWTRIDALAAVLLVILAAIPRAYNLLGLDPFVDEASWTDWAFRLFEWTSPRTWIIPLVTDGRPPLFVWWMVPFGMVVDNGILAGRLAAATAGALTAAALYGLGREASSRTLGATAAIVWALSPFAVFFARIAADDALLTLLAVLTTWASLVLARRPSVRAGVLCGLCLALTVFAKTTGVMLALAPVLALLLVGRPLAWRRYVRPLLAAVVVGAAVSAPLLIGVAALLQQVSIHTDSSASTGRDLLRGNLEVSAGWMITFVGEAFLALVGLGAVLAVVLRQRALLCLGLLGLILIPALLAVTTPLFARYLLFLSFPAYLLAAFPIEQASRLAARLPMGGGAAAGGLASSRAGAERLQRAAGAAVVLVGLAAALWQRADLAVDIVRDPVSARIPGAEHAGYVENWYAAYGLGQVVGRLQTEGQAGPVTVLVPPASREGRVMIPYGALRMYLRRSPNIRVVEVPALWRAQDLRDVRRAARDGPTYLVVNGTHTDGSGMPNEVPAFTRQLERRLAQDVPEAREVLRIPRPTAPNWLSLYRLDR
jgi:4-amino-4-deoxy-L-arabinose transferase-like glycosyltransferase